MRVAVVGAGLTAPFIAAAFAAAGMPVALAGRDPARTAAAADAARAAAGAGAATIAAAAIDGAGLAGADLVLESIVEDIAVKRDVLARVAALAPDAVIATNTSSIPIAELAAAVPDPGRFLGLHFLTPAHETGVLEVIRGAQTDDATIALALEVADRLGKRPILVRRDVPGFVWNRLQAALLREALHLLDEGVADAATIDAAVTDGLAPRWLAAGPLATVDLGGLAVFRTVCDSLFGELGRATASPPSLAERAEQGEPFRAWTPERRAAVLALRSEALAAGRGLALRRPAL